MEKKETAKERILRVASELFYREGIRAVGIDRIIEESGVAKASFYRNFATKDDLIVAYLEKKSRESLERVDEAERRYPDSPKMVLKELLDNLIDRLNTPENRGCAFMNTVVEFPDVNHPGHKTAVEHRRELWRRIEDIARRGGAQNPEELASQLRMLCSGAIMVSYTDKAAFHAEYLRNAIRVLIENHSMK